MRLSFLRIYKAESCGGLLDGVDINFYRKPSEETLSPICILGPNGSGKSQMLQLLAEIFQAAWHAHDKSRERNLSNSETLFDLQYEILDEQNKPKEVRLFRDAKTSKTKIIQMQIKKDGSWEDVKENESSDFGSSLPPIVVGYTSGDNETLSLPFYLSRSGYAADLAKTANNQELRGQTVADNVLYMVDYSAHLEVLVANLALGSEESIEALLGHAKLTGMTSFRCIIQLRPSTISNGVNLTDELQNNIDALKACATAWNYEEGRKKLTLDFFTDDASRVAFSHYFKSPTDLFKAFQRLTMLNDLSISLGVREQYKKSVQERRFMTRLPEPQDDDKVFRFERILLEPIGEPSLGSVDYVSLSDGEHQQAQVLGIFNLVEQKNALFLFDEPESHFNPKWRIKFAEGLTKLVRNASGSQEFLLTTHSPFVPSDMHRENVLVFGKTEDGKVKVTEPAIETFGTSFDDILAHCFDIQPAISTLARKRIEELKISENIDEIKDAMQKLGSSTEKIVLFDRLRQLEKGS